MRPRVFQSTLAVSQPTIGWSTSQPCVSVASLHNRVPHAWALNQRSVSFIRVPVRSFHESVITLLANCDAR